MKSLLTLTGEYTDLNTYIQAERGSKHSAAEIKKSESERVAWEAKAQKMPSYTTQVTCEYVFHRMKKNKDEDNLLFTIKFINDGLKMAMVIPDDSPKWLHIGGVQFLYNCPTNKTEVIIDEST